MTSAGSGMAGGRGGAVLEENDTLARGVERELPVGPEESTCVRLARGTAGWSGSKRPSS